MGIRRIFSTSINRINHNKRMWFILFGIQLIFAVTLIIPIRSEVNKMIGHSLIGQEVLQGSGANVFFEFLAHHSETVSIEIKLLFIIGLIYLLTSIFLNGGIIGCFIKEDNEYSATLFFGSSGKYFGRFFRLFLLSIPFLIIAFLLSKGISNFIKGISPDSEPIQVTAKVTGYIILLFLIFFINMVFDYAKIRTVFQERRSMIMTTLRSMGFVLKNLGKTLGLYYLIAAVGLAFFIIYTIAGKLIPISTGIGILLLFLWQQLYSLGRIWVRLLFLSSETRLYKNIVPLSINE